MRKSFFLSLAVGLMAGAAIRQAPQQKVIQSKVFEVLDKTGQTRASPLSYQPGTGVPLWRLVTRSCNLLSTVPGHQNSFS